jgi:hypothetical protein
MNAVKNTDFTIIISLSRPKVMNNRKERKDQTQARAANDYEAKIVDAPCVMAAVDEYRQSDNEQLDRCK